MQNNRRRTLRASAGLAVGVSLLASSLALSGTAFAQEGTPAPTTDAPSTTTPGTATDAPSTSAAPTTATAAPAAETAAPSAAPAAPAAPVATPAAAPNGTTVRLININDFHGRIQTDLTQRFAQTVENLRAKAPTAGSSVLLSAGDNIGASLFASSAQQDAPTLQVLNALGLKASAVGNHEFDRGFGDLTGRVKDAASFPYLGANVTKGGQPALQEYETITLDSGVRVAVIGVVTQETPTLVSKSGVEGLEFGDPVAAVNRVAAKLRGETDPAKKPDVIVAEYHEGAPAGTPEGASLAEELTASSVFAHIVKDTQKSVDVIFTGHTHKEYAWQDADGRAIVQTGSYGANLGVVDLTIADGRVKTDKVQNVKAVTGKDDQKVDYTNPTVKKVDEIVKAAEAKAKQVGGKVLGKLGGPITTAFAPNSAGELSRDDRGSESSMGHLVANMYRDSLAPSEIGGAEIGIVNPGGLRSDFNKKAGDDITVQDVIAVTPFANNLWTVTISGETLKGILEDQWQLDAKGQVPSRTYLQLGLSSNVQYTYFKTADHGQHIDNIYVNDKLVQPTDTFKVAVPSFLKDGGDNFHSFLKATAAKDSGLVDSDAFQSYVQNKGTVYPDNQRQAMQVEYTMTDTVVDYTMPKVDLTSIGAPKNTVADVTLVPNDASPLLLRNAQSKTRTTGGSSFFAGATEGLLGDAGSARPAQLASNLAYPAGSIELGSVPVDANGLHDVIDATKIDAPAGEYRVVVYFPDTETVTYTSFVLTVAGADAATTAPVTPTDGTVPGQPTTSVPVDGTRPGAGGGNGLAETGAPDLAPMGLAALALLVLGGAATAVRSRRSSRL